MSLPTSRPPFCAARRRCCPRSASCEVVRHFTRLSQLNFSIDTHFYPLGSCTMKYNPKACNQYAMLPEFSAASARAGAIQGQGFLACMYELQEMLKEVTGMRGVSLNADGGRAGRVRRRRDDPRLSPRARRPRAQRDHRAGGGARHQSRHRDHVRLQGARDPTVDAEGDVDLDALRAAVGPNTAGIMLTNPSTLGVFERRIEEVARIVHDGGGLLYYDGANLNAILGKVRPGDMGFDVIHMNLHKTFSTPHGGGGPGAGRSAWASGCCRSCRCRWSGDRRTALTAGSPSGTCRRRSGGCRPSWAMPACCCAPTSTCACSAAKACSASASTPR
jgi:glycine dehydrogenase subunit 2